MTRTIEQIKADIAAVDAALDAALKSAKRQSKVDRAMNEGGEGYAHGDVMSGAAFDAWSKAVTPLKAELFAAEWTPEVTASRRAAWNAAMVAAGKQITTRQLLAIQTKLGFTMADLKKAVGK